MNYLSHYDRLIARARGRTLTGYRERHHVLPRCMGGDDSPSNVVELTPEEHYVAHQLLVKMHPGNWRLVSSAVLMSGRRSLNNKKYGWLRKLSIEACRQAARKPRKSLSPEHRQKLSAAKKGIKLPPRSLQHRQHLSESSAQRGKPGHSLGMTFTRTAETCAKLSAAARGNKRCVGRRLSAETRAKIGAKSKGRTKSLESRARVAESMRRAWLEGRHRRLD